MSVTEKVGQGECKRKSMTETERYKVQETDQKITTARKMKK